MWRRIAGGKTPTAEPTSSRPSTTACTASAASDSKTEDDSSLDGDCKLCTIHLTPVERVKEKNYFFRLSAYADKLLAWYDDAVPVQPESRRNEVRAVRQGRPARPVDLARDVGQVGDPVPGDPEPHRLRLD